jgi:hypothetical protein
MILTIVVLNSVLRVFSFFSSNLFDKVSPVVSYKVDLAVLAAVEIRGSV